MSTLPGLEDTVVPVNHEDFIGLPPEKKGGGLDVFKDILPSILTTKNYILNDEKAYVPFLVNKMLSYHDDALYYSNEMNMKYDLPNRLQYDFLFHSIRSKKRGFTPWIKVPKSEDLDAVMIYFGYSRAKAQQSLNILTEDQLVMIKKNITVGECNGKR